MNRFLILAIVAMLSAVAMAQDQPVGISTALEINSVSRVGDAYAIGKTFLGGGFVKITDDLFTIAMVEYSDNGLKATPTDDVTTLGGFVGFSWDWLTLKHFDSQADVELFLLFQGGAEEVRQDGFDPSTRFSWLSGVGMKFPVKNTKMIGEFHARLVNVTAKDEMPGLYKIAVGLGINSYILSK